MRPDAGGARAARPAAANPRDLAGLAEHVAREAGSLIVRRRREGVEVAGTKSTPTDIVTRVDHESERYIRDHLLAHRPRDGLIAEEGTSVASRSGVTWIIDPIDGTVNYLYGIPTYTVSIAAQVDGEVVAGAVVDPVDDEAWTAVRDGGAYLNGSALRLTAAPPLHLALVATGFGYTPERRAAQLDVLRSVIVNVRDVRVAGSSALDLCSVAGGRIDAFYMRGLNAWDTAAGLLVAEEAGAVVGGLNGAAPGQDLVIAANPSIFAELHDLLAAAKADCG